MPKNKGVQLQSWSGTGALFFGANREGVMLIKANSSYVTMRIQGAVSKRLLSVLEQEYGGSFRLIRETSDDAKVLAAMGLVHKVDGRKTLGDAVRNHRENREWTRAQLGKKLGVPASFIADLETGRRFVTRPTTKDLAKIFGISITRFV